MSNYLDRLKSLNLRPNKITIKEYTPSEETILMEEERILTELFVQVGEIESLPPGIERDTQILRLAMIAELDAVNLYDKLSTIATSENVRKLMMDVSHEEKVHAGEFETLMEELDPSYEKAEEEGEEEVENLIGITDEE